MAMEHLRVAEMLRKGDDVFVVHDDGRNGHVCSPSYDALCGLVSVVCIDGVDVPIPSDAVVCHLNGQTVVVPLASISLRRVPHTFDLPAWLPT